MSWEWWAIGVLIFMAGACFGLVLVSLMVVASNADDATEDR